jgi:sugar O-acyltransferase (sialic acid O-acetyltransferase NeuD family)
MTYKYSLPSEDVNDESALISEIYFTSGDKVKKSDLIYLFETTKTTVEVESRHNGYILYNCLVGDQLEIGTNVCEIFETKEKYEKATKKNIAEKKEYKLTKKAKLFAKEKNIKLEDLELYGVIKENDLKSLISKSAKNKINSPNINFEKDDIVILGIGGHSSICIDILNSQNSYNFRGFITKDYKSIKIQENFIGCDIMLPDFHKQGLRNIIIGIVDISSKNGIRELLYNKMKKNGFQTPNLIHNSSIIEPSSNLGQANQVMAGATIGSNCTVGNNNIINTGAIISHDSIINNNVHIAPGAIIAADVTIGDNSLIGMGVTIYRGLNIGRNVVISNGQNIFKDIKDNEMIYESK